MIGAMIVLAAICVVTMENQINQKCESFKKPSGLQKCFGKKNANEEIVEEKC